jgi:hypothetical protein
MLVLADGYQLAATLRGYITLPGILNYERLPQPPLPAGE